MQIVAQGTLYPLGNPNPHILIAEESVDVGQLDRLADKLFLAGWQQSAA